MIIKILEHKIHRTEPSVLINNNILINAPKFSKDVPVNHVLLTHTHKENLRGLSHVLPTPPQSLNIYLYKEHERWLKYHCPKIYLDACLKFITPKKKFKITDTEIVPISVQHSVQKVYGTLCFAFLLDKRVMLCSPCNKISNNSKKYFKDLDVLIIDGGYRKSRLYNDHNSIMESLVEFKNSNIKHIYFLGTHGNYKIKGNIKDSDISVDTLVTGDIITIK